MTKKQLALLVFCIAFGVNILAFLFSSKTFSVEEDKNVWIYELPATASPLDASAASLSFGPQQGIIGTLFMPKSMANEANATIENELADQWTWDQSHQIFSVKLKAKLIYSDGSPILASHWVAATQWVQSKMKAYAWSKEWTAFLQAKISAVSETELRYDFSSVKGIDFQAFAKQVLTHSLSGVIHPQNLAALMKGEALTKAWISSGPYRVRKWIPKEITLVSRDDFAVALPKKFFRTIKFQSAPVKNPSCDFIQARLGEEKPYSEHLSEPLSETVHVFWICRSAAQKGSFCSDPANRSVFAKLLKGQDVGAQALAGKTLRYRIPTGSDHFREQIRSQIEAGMKKAGGIAQEVSYFFKASSDADLELQFMVTQSGSENEANAASFANLSTRVASQANVVAQTSGASEANLVGEIESFSIQALTKGSRGDVFHKLFLDPDLDEKKIPI